MLSFTRHHRYSPLTAVRWGSRVCCALISPGCRSGLQTQTKRRKKKARRLAAVPDTESGSSSSQSGQEDSAGRSVAEALSCLQYLLAPKFNLPNLISMNSVRETVILGSGCSGLTAAIYAARANLKPLVVEGHEPGGQLAITTLVENFPGWPEGIQGPELIENIKKQAGRFGAEYYLGHLQSADLSKRPFKLDFGKDHIYTQTLIIASGASARWLGLPSEQALIGHGVTSCATCDGFFFRGKEVTVIGGGDSAMEEALFLTRFATKVTIIHRRNEFRASKIMLDRAREHEKIRFLTNTIVEEVCDVSQKEVTGLRLRNVKTGKTWD